MGNTTRTRIKNSSSSINFDKFNPLPFSKDVINVIFQFLTLREISRACTSLKGFFYCFSNLNEDLWEYLLFRDYGAKSQPEKGDSKLCYIEKFCIGLGFAFLKRGGSLKEAWINDEKLTTYPKPPRITDCCADENIIVVTITGSNQWSGRYKTFISFLVLDIYNGKLLYEHNSPYEGRSCVIYKNNIIISIKQEGRVKEDPFIVIEKSKLITKNKFVELRRFGGLKFDLIRGTTKKRIKGHSSDKLVVKIIRQDNKMFSLSEDGALFAWNLDTFKMMWTINIPNTFFSTQLFFGYKKNILMTASCYLNEISFDDHSATVKLKHNIFDMHTRYGFCGDYLIHGSTSFNKINALECNQAYRFVRFDDTSKTFNCLSTDYDYNRQKPGKYVIFSFGSVIEIYEWKKEMVMGKKDLKKFKVYSMNLTYNIQRIEYLGKMILVILEGPRIVSLVFDHDSLHE